MEKLCTTCKCDKPLFEFSKNASAKDGLQSRCKPCARAGTADYARRNAEKVRANKAEFRNQPENKEKMRAYLAEYCERNAEKLKAAKAANYQANKAKRNAASKAYAERNKELVSEQGRARYEANRERLKAAAAARYAENGEEIRAKQIARHAARPERRRAVDQRMRAKRMSAPGSHTAADIKALMKLQRGLCVGCRCDIRVDFHVDHIEPLAKGGSNDRTNLQLLCPTCNRSKHARSPVEFMQSRGFLL